MQTCEMKTWESRGSRWSRRVSSGDAQATTRLLNDRPLTGIDRARTTKNESRVIIIRPRGTQERRPRAPAHLVSAWRKNHSDGSAPKTRSEERRVGKECRWRGSQYDGKKKE